MPAEIVWRDKEQFDEGSGTVDLLDEVRHDHARDTDWDAYEARHAQDRLRSSEECYYHQLLVRSYERPEPALRNVGRWPGGEF